MNGFEPRISGVRSDPLPTEPQPLLDIDSKRNIFTSRWHYSRAGSRSNTFDDGPHRTEFFSNEVELNWVLASYSLNNRSWVQYREENVQLKFILNVSNATHFLKQSKLKFLKLAKQTFIVFNFVNRIRHWSSSWFLIFKLETFLNGSPCRILLE